MSVSDHIECGLSSYLGNNDLNLKVRLYSFYCEMIGKTLKLGIH